MICTEYAKKKKEKENKSHDNVSHVEFRAKSIRNDIERQIKGTNGDNSQRRYVLCISVHPVTVRRFHTAENAVGSKINQQKQ